MNALITREVDYAIRICAYLAGYDRKDPIPVSRIAKRLLITKPFTTKIIYRLRQAQVVDSIQGKNGGIYLAQDPAKLSMFAIFEAMEFKGTLNECLQIEHVCPLAGVCRIHRFFADQQDQLTQNLKKQMISDFAFTDEALDSIHLLNG